MLNLLLILLLFTSIGSLSGQDSLAHHKTDTLFERGLLTQQAGQFMESNQYFQRASQGLRASQRWNRYLDAQNQIARNYWKMEKLDSASLVCQLVAASPHLKKGSLIEATLFNNIGVVHDIRAEYKEALKNFQQCLRIRKEKLGDDHIETGKLYYNIGACYELQNQYYASLEYREKALRNFKKNLPPNHPFFLAVYKGMMNTYFFLEKYEEVIAYIETALSIAKKIYPSDHPRIGYFYSQLGIAKTKIPSSEQEGIRLVKKGFEISKKYYGEEHPDLIWKYINLASISNSFGNMDKVIDYQSKALYISLKNYGTKSPKYSSSSQQLSNYYQKLQQDSMALLHAHNAILATLPTVADSIAIDSIPDFAMVPVSNIIKLTTNVVNLVRILSANLDKKTKYKEYYYAYLLATDALFNRAQKEISNKKDKVEILDKLNELTALKVKYYKSLPVDTKNKEALLENAIQTMDKSKSLLLKLSLATNKARQFGGVPDHILSKERKLRKDIAKIDQQIWEEQTKGKSTETLEEELFQLKKEYTDLEKILEVAYKKYYELKYKEESVDLSYVQENLLTSKSLLIQYMQTDNHVYIATISSSAMQLDYFKKDEKYRQALKDIRKSLSNVHYARSQKDNGVVSFSEKAYFLYNRLLQPYIQDSTITELIIIPDGDLNRIPFETLVYDNKVGEEASFKALDYLSNRYTVRYAYSAKLLIDAQQTGTTGANHILAFAASYDPSKTNDVVRSKLIELEGVQQEVKGLQESFQGQFYLDKKATEATIKAVDFSRFGVLHLAMHGLLNKDNPMQSAMAFTEDTESAEDDFLHAYEITNMDIRTNLVVLSACETGDGKHQKIEGIMSLGRSFMYAGTPSIIMSLWQVSDYSTAQIMQQFYQNLAKGQSKSMALRNAKFYYLELVKNKSDLFSHPFFWGAFISLGDDRNVPIQHPINYKAWIMGSVGFLCALLLLVYLWRRR